MTFQYLIYDEDNLLADIGGYLGLLLGQSLFGIYGIVFNCLSRKAKCACACAKISEERRE